MPLFFAAGNQQIHSRCDPRASLPVRHPHATLVGDVIGKEVGQHSKQSQPTDGVPGENPGSSAFMLSDRCGGWRGLLVNRRNCRGPIFHAKPPNGTIVAQVDYASRLPRRGGRTTAGRGFYSELKPAPQRNVTGITELIGKLICIRGKTRMPIGSTQRCCRQQQCCGDYVEERPFKGRVKALEKTGLQAPCSAWDNRGLDSLLTYV